MVTKYVFSLILLLTFFDSFRFLLEGRESFLSGFVCIVAIVYKRRYFSAKYIQFQKQTSMATFVFLFILSIGLQVGASNLDTAFDAFLSSSSSSSGTGRSYQDDSATVKNLYKLYKQEYSRPFISSAIDNIRYGAFNETVFILLKDHQQGAKTYNVKLNKYTDWTSAELSELAGVRVPQNGISNTNTQPGQRLLSLDGKEVQGKALVLSTSYDYTTRVVTGTNTPIVSISSLFPIQIYYKLIISVTVTTNPRSRPLWFMLCIRFYCPFRSSICLSIKKWYRLKSTTND